MTAIDAARLLGRIRALGQVGRDAAGRLTRLAGSDADRQGRDGDGECQESHWVLSPHNENEFAGGQEGSAVFKTRRFQKKTSKQRAMRDVI